MRFEAMYLVDHSLQLYSHTLTQRQKDQDSTTLLTSYVPAVSGGACMQSADI